MVITDVLYDLTVGVAGAVIGALIMLMFNRKKTRRLSNEILVNRHDLEKLRLENNKLIETIKDRETQILKLQRKILQKKSKS
jgi:gas vesicle protein